MQTGSPSDHGAEEGSDSASLRAALEEIETARQRAEARTEVLSRVSRSAATGASPTSTLEVIAEELVRHIADTCISFIRSGTGLVAVSVRDRDPIVATALEAGIGGGAYRSSSPAFLSASERGEAVLVEVIDAAAREKLLADVPSSVEPTLRAHSPVTSMYLPVVRGAEVDAVLILSRRDPGPQFTREDLAFCREIADWAALSLENARLEDRRRDIELELARSERRFRRLAENVPVVVHRVRVRPEFSFEYVSPSVLPILGFTPDQIYADPWIFWDSVHQDDRGVLDAMTADPDALARPFTVRHLHPDGRLVWTETRCNVEYDEDGRPILLEGVTTDITAAKENEAELYRRALHDPLTGLPNRMLFHEHLQHAFARRRRRAASVALLYVDLDDFKSVNDRLGHAAGDRLLAEVATRLARSVRPSDTVARLGGDEFAVLVEDVGEPEMPVRICARIEQSFTEPVDIEGHPVRASASIGIAYSGAGTTSTADDLMRHADAAMYAAKGSGGGRYEIFDSHLRARVDERLHVEHELRRALERDEFVLEYQPEVRLATGEVVGVEALLRWKHPERGMLEPQAFLQAAEDTGLVVPIGTWVLQEACQLRRSYQEAFGSDAPVVGVNLSPRQLADPDVVTDVASVVADAGVDPGGLMFDVTEQGLLEDPPVSLAALQAFRRLGLRVAVDDFGTGFASLSIVRSFPVDLVKIDRSVVAALGSDPGATAMCRAVIDLSRGLGLEVSAEGVETPAQRQALVELGCAYAQGDLFAAPAPPEALQDLLGGLRAVR